MFQKKQKKKNENNRAEARGKANTGKAKKEFCVYLMSSDMVCVCACVFGGEVCWLQKRKGNLQG